MPPSAQHARSRRRPPLTFPGRIDVPDTGHARERNQDFAAALRAGSGRRQASCAALRNDADALSVREGEQPGNFFRIRGLYDERRSPHIKVAPFAEIRRLFIGRCDGIRAPTISAKRRIRASSSTVERSGNDVMDELPLIRMRKRLP